MSTPTPEVVRTERTRLLNLATQAGVALILAAVLGWFMYLQTNMTTAMTADFKDMLKTTLSVCVGKPQADWGG